ARHAVFKQGNHQHADQQLEGGNHDGQQQSTRGEVRHLPPREEDADKHLQHHQLFKADAPLQHRKAVAAVFGERPFLQLLLGFGQIERQLAHLDKGGERAGAQRQHQRKGAGNRPVVHGVGDKADVRGTRNLRGDPQPQQQDRLNQHTQHRLAAGTEAGKRTSGVQTRNRKEETGDGEEVDKRDQIAKRRQR
ncbi:hypothetical protein COLO4_03096, partial [Corchorus olitorius]